MNSLRRTMLKRAGGAMLATLGVVSGLLPVRQALAAWNSAAFEAKTPPEALKQLGVAATAESGEIDLKAPEIAENGAVVPIEVTSRIQGTQSIAILVDKNPQPLAASFTFSNGAEPLVNVRLKMGQSSNVRAIVQANGKYYATARQVKVTIGGCGG